MVRNRKNSGGRKIGKTDGNIMKEAVHTVIIKGKSIRSTAEDFNIKNSTLRRYVTKFKTMANEHMRYTPIYTCRQVFTTEDEVILKDYLVKAAEIQYVQTRMQVRELAYELAYRNKKSMPASWVENKCAGEDWFYGYMKRFPELFLRRPEATSLSRATSFNKTNVGEFYTNLEGHCKSESQLKVSCGLEMLL